MQRVKKNSFIVIIKYPTEMKLITEDFKTAGKQRTETPSKPEEA